MDFDVTHALAGNSIFTVENNSGEHRTFKIRKSEDGNIHFVSVLSSPEDYSYMGILRYDQYGNFSCKATRKSTFNSESKAMRIFNFAARVIQETQELPEGYDIHHEGRCCRCGRRLTTPESIKAGIGPECANKI